MSAEIEEVLIKRPGLVQDVRGNAITLRPLDPYNNRPAAVGFLNQFNLDFKKSKPSNERLTPFWSSLIRCYRQRNSKVAEVFLEGAQDTEGRATPVSLPLLEPTPENIEADLTALTKLGILKTPTELKPPQLDSEVMQLVCEWRWLSAEELKSLYIGDTTHAEVTGVYLSRLTRA